MKENKGRNYRYKLCGLDSNHNFVVIYETETIFEMDCFTSHNFCNKEDMQKKIEEKYNRQFLDIFIASNIAKKEEQITYTNNIIFDNNVIPENDKLCNIYLEYLLEDRRRIRTSFYYYMPRFKDENIYMVSDEELRLLVKNIITSYKKRRDIYFELLNHGKIKLVNIAENQKEKDYLSSLLDSIECNKLKDESENIILEKVINSEEEPFSCFDLEDYQEMSQKKRR